MHEHAIDPCTPAAWGGQPHRHRIDANTIRTEGGCRVWNGAKQRNGYGKFKYAGKVQLVHRVAYMLANGPIPEGLHIDHVADRGCRNRACINPEHLEAITQAENNRRAARSRFTQEAAA